MLVQTCHREIKVVLISSPENAHIFSLGCFWVPTLCSMLYFVSWETFFPWNPKLSYESSPLLDDRFSFYFILFLFSFYILYFFQTKLTVFQLTRISQQLCEYCLYVTWILIGEAAHESFLVDLFLIFISSIDG